MSRVGLNNRPPRPKLPNRSTSSLLELITQKSIDQISDLNFVATHLAELDEGVDDFRYPERSFFAFPQPLHILHSTARTIRLTMPKSKESGVDDKVCYLIRLALQHTDTKSLIAKWRRLLGVRSRHCCREHDWCCYVRTV